MVRITSSLSRDTRVQIVIGLATVVLFALAAATDVADDGPTAVAFVVAIYGLLFGGAHLYLAIRGEDGMIPVAARWRYLAALAVVLGCGAILLMDIDWAVGSIALETVALWVLLATVAVYVVVEGVAGYRATRAD